MRKTQKLFGITVFVAVIVLLMTSASVWDSKTPKADRVSLYYPDNFEIEAINGETKSLGPVTRTFPGKGKLENGKLSLVIAPGQTTILMNEKVGFSRSSSEISYNFEPGGHYRLIPKVKEGTTMADAAKAGVGAAESIFNWVIEKIK
jgi:hypothetical protein